MRHAVRTLPAILALALALAAGAKSPADEAADPAAIHWAFRPVVRPPVPTPRGGAARNPIDAFVRARLDKDGVKPAPEADRVTLLRRVSLDLTGLPPTPDEVAAFVKDTKPDAFERQVDRLLASPHYGERWGRVWLDLARYADSNGFSVDSPRSIWAYRDWVLAALNADLPFDQFTVEQLAGDLLPNATRGQRIATGFHRNTLVNEEGGVDVEQFRVEAVVDRVNTTGGVWLGLTVGCCQCHNHKFDPISQRDYYRLLAFFNNQDDTDLFLDPPDAKADPKVPAKKPAGPKTLVLAERAVPRETHVMLGGDFTRKGVKVAEGTPAVLPPLPKLDHRPTRLDLARWLVAPENPLTARVFVNRVWGVYFGTGLVATENDFGTQGTLPTHPELLDWLAAEFVRLNWSQKAFHRLVVTSATYRQSSKVRPDLADGDPRNLLLARQTRLRLDAELVRDVALAASGLLDPKVGGPSVYPPQPAGSGQVTQVNRAWTVSAGGDRYRRGMYTHFQRSAPHPALTAFDAPDATTTCTRRNRSTTPLQALTLLNDPGFAEYPYGLADRLLREPDGTPVSRVAAAFRVCLSREPSAREATRLLAFGVQQEKHFAGHPGEAKTLLAADSPAAKKLAGLTGVPDEVKAATVLLARAVLNLDEFITRE